MTDDPWALPKFPLWKDQIKFCINQMEVRARKKKEWKTKCGWDLNVSGIGGIKFNKTNI